MNVIFDLDDTLYLERDYVRSGFQAVAGHLGDPDFARRAWGHFELGARGNIFDLALMELGRRPDPDLMRTLVQLYRAHRPTIALASDAAACLDALRGTASLGLITDGPAISQRNKIEALKLAERIDRIIVTDELGKEQSKPSPAPFLLAQNDHEPARCVYVGDNPAKDFAGPIRLGWHSVRIRRPGGLHAQAPDDPVFPAEKSIASLAELRGLIDSWSR